MTKQQTTILWLGLILIGLNIVVHIGDVKSVIFGGSSKPAPAQSSNSPNVLAPGPPPPITTPGTGNQQTPSGTVVT